MQRLSADLRALQSQCYLTLRRIVFSVIFFSRSFNHLFSTHIFSIHSARTHREVYVTTGRLASLPILPRHSPADGGHSWLGPWVVGNKAKGKQNSTKNCQPYFVQRCQNSPENHSVDTDTCAYAVCVLKMYVE